MRRKKEKVKEEVRDIFSDEADIFATPVKKEAPKKEIPKKRRNPEKRRRENCCSGTTS